MNWSGRNMSDAGRLPEEPTEAAILAAGAGPDPRDDTIAVLEKKLQRMEDSLYEERFVWIILLVVLFDAIAFTHMVNWAGALVIGILQLVLLTVLADWLRVNAWMPLLDRLTGYLPKGKTIDVL